MALWKRKREEMPSPREVEERIRNEYYTYIESKKKKDRDDEIKALIRSQQSKPLYIRVIEGKTNKWLITLFILVIILLIFWILNLYNVGEFDVYWSYLSATIGKPLKIIYDYSSRVLSIIYSRPSELREI